MLGTVNTVNTGNDFLTGFLMKKSQCLLTFNLKPFLFYLFLFRVNTLFNIWIKYKPRLPEWYYNERLVKVGDALAQIKFHALQARNVCIYQMVCSRDRNLQNQESLQTCLNVLTSLRLTMQVALPQENLCWLIYNGSIFIICMESSIPLLSVHYLTWRATLYTAVSQCYFDCQADIHGEIFARRGLIKIDEVKQLEDISSLKHTETAKIFREATLKMAVMIFKRAVYVSRGKSSSVRPEPKVNPRKAVNLSWPRTTTERLLVEMFDGAAAQFLAILEALSDRKRNLFPPHPPIPDGSEICSVTSELFSAGLEILSGNSLKNTGLDGYLHTFFAGLWAEYSLGYREKGVSGDAAVKFVKLAFSYEEWNVFYSALEFVDNFLQAQDDPTWKKAEIELKLLTLIQPLIFPGKFERSFSATDNSKKARTLKDPFQDLMILATTVFSCVSTSDQNVHPDKEILVNVVMCLWQKCKTELQQIQMSGSDFGANQPVSGEVNFVTLHSKIVLSIWVSFILSLSGRIWR
uniref:Uncharacterized protein n=1 Tax=Catharus ustulatus TaxID=91951 RepID=A0A8C3U2M6_CATUS